MGPRCSLRLLKPPCRLLFDGHDLVDDEVLDAPRDLQLLGCPSDRVRPPDGPRSSKYPTFRGSPASRTIKGVVFGTRSQKYRVISVDLAIINTPPRLGNPHVDHALQRPKALSTSSFLLVLGLFCGVHVEPSNPVSSWRAVGQVRFAARL